MTLLRVLASLTPISLGTVASRDPTTGGYIRNGNGWVKVGNFSVLVFEEMGRVGILGGVIEVGELIEKPKIPRHQLVSYRSKRGPGKFAAAVASVRSARTRVSLCPRD
ncbi:hypothetical protein Tco_1265966 [Tanacetum coccineum]